MKLENRIEELAESGKRLKQFVDGTWSPSNSQISSVDDLLHRAHIKNNWFQPQMVSEMLKEVIAMLDKRALQQWVEDYDFGKTKPQNVAIIMAGNIPMVGFHDLLSVLISGHVAWIKLSSKDEVLIPFWLEILLEINTNWKQKIELKSERMIGMDAVIATGSNNSARYFDYYFGKYPHIIRKNRTSVALLTGEEDDSDLQNLSRDMLLYFGLGCRNVSKLFLPKDFRLDQIFENILDWKFITDNQKYNNNYEYNRTVYLLNREPFLDNNFFMLKESESLVSPISVVHYQRYERMKEVDRNLQIEKENIQCVIGKNHTPFGHSQSPKLDDFADEIDVLKFLSSL